LIVTYDGHIQFPSQINKDLRLTKIQNGGKINPFRADIFSLKALFCFVI
jgi:hypothetical protein